MSHLNVNGWTDLNSELRINIIKHSMSDIISLNETKLKKSENLEIDGYFWYGNNRSYTHVEAPTASGGVGFLVRESLANIYNFEEIDKSFTDIIAMKLSHKISNFNFLIISAYLPPESSPWGRDASAFFNHILQLMYTYHDCDAIFLMGDINARIADMVDFDESVDNVKSRCNNVDVKINSHGRSFVEFLLDSKCCVLNGRVTPDTSNKFTYHSVRGLSSVDYIVCPHDNIQLCSDFKIESCSEMIDNLGLQQLVTPNSRIPDHSLLTVKLKLDFRELESLNLPDVNQCDNVNNIVRKRYKVRYIPQDFLNSERVCLALQGVIDSIQCNRETQHELDEIYNNLINIITDEMNEKLLIPHTKHTNKRFRIKKPYWTEELSLAWKAMHDSECDFVNFYGPRREKLSLKSKFTFLTHKFDKLLKQTKRTWDRGHLISIEKLNTTNPTEFWHHISKLGPRTSNKIPLETLLEDGSITRDKYKVLSKWQHDYEELYLNNAKQYDDTFLLKCQHELKYKENVF